MPCIYVHFGMARKTHNLPKTFRLYTQSESLFLFDLSWCSPQHTSLLSTLLPPPQFLFFAKNGLGLLWTPSFCFSSFVGKHPSGLALSSHSVFGPPMNPPTFPWPRSLRGVYFFVDRVFFSLSSVVGCHSLWINIAFSIICFKTKPGVPLFFGWWLAGITWSPPCCTRCVWDILGVGTLLLSFIPVPLIFPPFFYWFFLAIVLISDLLLILLFPGVFSSPFPPLKFHNQGDPAPPRSPSLPLNFLCWFFSSTPHLFPRFPFLFRLRMVRTCRCLRMVVDSTRSSPPTSYTLVSGGPRGRSASFLLLLLFPLIANGCSIVGFFPLIFFWDPETIAIL